MAGSCSRQRWLDQDGLLLKILLSGGLYRYDAANLGGEQR